MVDEQPFTYSKINLTEVLTGIDSVLNENGLFYMGVYGGEDRESFWTNDISDTPRFFSYYSELKLKEARVCALLRNSALKHSLATCRAPRRLLSDVDVRIQR